MRIAVSWIHGQSTQRGKVATHHEVAHPDPGGPAILTHPMDIDNLIRSTMGAFYQGNVPHSRQDFLLPTFLRKFGQHFVQAEPFPVPELRWHHLQQAIHRSPDNTWTESGKETCCS